MTAGGFEQPFICKAVARNIAIYTVYRTVHHKGSVKANGLHVKGSEFKQPFSYRNLYMRCEESSPPEVFL